ncbi:sterile alpha motif-like domain-containing protein [Staphylococcus haemolyticus]|nr:sterile alpha motif-like domain-containing protein [Staphylococcus haemolyticus]
MGDQTPLGELAHWISQDQHFPKYERISDNILSYFTKITTLDHEFLEIVKRSISLYEQSQL